MNTVEHAQHIYTQMIAAWLATGHDQPSQAEFNTWFTTAMNAAKAFHDLQIGKK